jgi:hypothetical protein
MSDDDCKEKCCTYLCFAFIVLYILYLFWQLIVVSFVIIVIVICIYRVIAKREIKFSSPFERKDDDHYTYTPPKQSYRIEEEKPPRKLSRTTTPSAEVAEIIERILQQKPEYTRNDILTMVREKKSEMGVETITDEVAVNLVVAELGVELSPKRGRPRKTGTPRRESKTYIDPNGYKRYSNSDRLVHRHIAEIYVVRRKLREDEDVHHINGNKLDNRAVNLRVMTWREHKDLHER